MLAIEQDTMSQNDDLDRGAASFAAMLGRAAGNSGHPADAVARVSKIGEGRDRDS